MNIVLSQVTVNEVVKGRNRYSVAEVAYQFNGEARTQKIMSFANPAVFAAVQEFSPGDALDVTVTKNAAGYNEWASVKKVGGGAAPSAAAAPTGGKAPASNFETREERAQRQIYIIRQSSLERALEYIKLVDNGVGGVPDVLQVAEQFVNYVMNGDAQGPEESVD